VDRTLGEPRASGFSLTFRPGGLQCNSGFVFSLHLPWQYTGHSGPAAVPTPWQSHLTYQESWAAQQPWGELNPPSLSRLLHSPCITSTMTTPQILGCDTSLGGGRNTQGRVCAEQALPGSAAGLLCEGLGQSPGWVPDCAIYGGGSSGGAAWGQRLVRRSWWNRGKLPWEVGGQEPGPEPEVSTLVSHRWGQVGRALNTCQSF
jgi:hypothetical protein